MRNTASKSHYKKTDLWDSLPVSLHHHTITTGHSRISERSEVRADLDLESHVADMMKSEAPIPNFENMFANADVDGDVLTVHVMSKDMALVSFVVAPSINEASRKAFADLVDKDMTKIGNQEPLAPYCSAAIYFGGILRLQELFWIADYERCIAWAWLAIVARQVPKLP